MGSLFRAIKRFFNGILYVLSGTLIDMSKGMYTSEAGVSASYDEIEHAHLKNIKQMVRGVSTLVAERERRKHQHKELVKDIAMATTQRSGAQTLAKKALEKIKAKLAPGEDLKEKLHADDDYQKASNFYNRLDQKIQDKNEEVDRLEKDLEKIETDIGKIKDTLTDMKDELGEIQKERAGTQADMAYGKATKAAADAISGIATSGASKLRSDMQKLRRETLAEAEVSSELAGTDNAYKELEKMAQEAVSNDKLDGLLGLSESVETATTVKDEPSKIPE